MNKDVPGGLAFICLAIATAMLSVTFWIYIQPIMDKFVLSGLTGFAAACIGIGGIMTIVGQPNQIATHQSSKPIPRRRGL